MIKALCMHSTATSALAGSKTPSTCVGRHTSPGAQPASAALDYSRGEQSVSSTHQTEEQSGIDIQFCDAIATEPREDDPMAMDADDIETWYGNRRRRLWKSTCIRAALNVHVLLRPHSPILIFLLILTPFFLSSPPSHSQNEPSSPPLPPHRKHPAY
jgi:hypothetical protein